MFGHILTFSQIYWSVCYSTKQEHNWRLDQVICYSFSPIQWETYSIESRGVLLLVTAITQIRSNRTFFWTNVDVVLTPTGAVSLFHSTFRGFMKNSSRLSTNVNRVGLPRASGSQIIDRPGSRRLILTQLTSYIEVTEVSCLETGGFMTLPATNISVKIEARKLWRPVLLPLAAAADQFSVGVVTEQTGACAGGINTQAAHHIITVQSGPLSLGSHFTV